MMWIALQFLLVALAIGMLLYYLRGPLLGMIVTFMVKLVLKKTFKQFKLTSLNLLPFAMVDFSVTLHATRKTPEVTISWSSFRILMDVTKIFDPLLSLLNVLSGTEDAPPRGRMISFVFDGFKASSPDLNFALFLDPPANKVPVPEGVMDANGDIILASPQDTQAVVSYKLIIKRLSQHIVLFVDIVFHDFSFNFTFPAHECKMIGSAAVMTISFPKWPVGTTNTVSVLNKIDGGEIEILQRDVRAMYYVGRNARLTVDLHLPTGVMDILFRVLGREHDKMYVTVARLIEFYRNYAHAEDNSIEIRMARGLPIGGKMTMRMECEYIDVHVSDNRCAEPLHMTIQQLEASLKTYSLTRGGERLYRGKRVIEPPDGEAASESDTTTEFAKKNLFQFFMRDKSAGPIIMSPNKEKVMKGAFKRMEFHTRDPSSIAYVEEVTGLKVKRVFNENDFVDNDRMNGYARCIHFEKISPYMLDWFVVLQDTANRLPESRFAHKKNSEIHGLVVDFLFSTQPVSFAYIPPPFPGSKEDINRSPDLVCDPPLETLDEVPVDENHWVCLKFDNLEGKRELPFGEHDALIDVKATVFKAESSMPQVGLQDLFSLTAVGDYDVTDEVGSSDSEHNSEENEGFYELHEDTPMRPEPTFAEIYGADSGSDPEDLRMNLGPMTARRLASSAARLSPIAEHSNSQFDLSVMTDRSLPALPEGAPLALESPVPQNLSQSNLPQPIKPKKSPQKQSKASTGTRWTFPSFSVRMKLGLKMHLEWIQATTLHVDFANSTMPDLITIHPNRPAVQFDPFMHASTLCALWTGFSVNCDLGRVSLQGSAAGMLKAQTGFNMIKKTSDRVNARMLNMKMRGWGPLTNPPPPEVTHADDPQPPPPRTAVHVSEFVIDVPVQISPEDHDKRLQHELAREQKQFLRAQQFAERKRTMRKNSFASTASDAEDLDNQAFPFPAELFMGVNRGDKSVKITLGGFSFATSTVDTSVSFDTCLVTLPSFPDRTWIDIKAFRFVKSTVPLETEDAFYQGLDLQASVEAAYITTKTKSEFHFDSFDMYLSARMELGLIADALSMQSAAFGIASKAPPHPLRSYLTEEEFESGSVSPHSPHSPSPMAQGDDHSRAGRYDSGENTVRSARSFSVAHDEEGESEDSSLELLKPNPTCMKVVIRTFAINYDAHYNKDYIEDFMRIEYMGIDMTLDSTKLPSATQDEITTLDLGAEGAEEDHDHLAQLKCLDESPKARMGHSKLLVYTGVFGGQLRFFTKFFKVAFKTSKDPFLEMEDLCFAGPFYSAAVKDPRVPKGEYLVELCDSVTTYAFDADTGSDADSGYESGDEQVEVEEVSPVHTALPAAVTGSTEPLYVVVSKNAAPGKMYMDLVMSGTSFDVCMTATTGECIAAANAVMDCVMPPVKDPSPHLAPWDTLRYLMHGSFAFNFKKMSVNYSAQDYMTQKVKIVVTMDLPKWYMDKSSFSLTAQNILVEAELITALLGGRRGRIKRASGKSAQATVVSKLCSIPAFVFSLNHFREDVRSKFASGTTAPGSENASAATSMANITNITPLTGSFRSDLSLDKSVEKCAPVVQYSHHDVYLNPAFHTPHSADAPAESRTLEDYQYMKGDKFYNFRSQIMTSRWEVEMRLADHQDVPICFNFRLDHLVRIIDAMKTQDGDRFTTPDESDGCLDQASDYFYGAMRPQTQLPLGDMLSVLKLQMIINRIMISSWPSSTNLGGVVMTVASTDMQLRMLRDIPEEFTTPKKIDPKKLSKRRSRRTPVAEEEEVEKTTVLVAFPLKIDHFFMDTSFCELYVRDWHMSGMGSPLDKKNSTFRASLTHALQFNADNAEEPKTFEEIQSLFVPIFKNAHATKMVISLTESGVVCTRDHMFHHSGIMDKSSERLSKLSNFSSKQHSARSSRRFNSHSALTAAALAEEENRGTFIIGKEWKEHLARTAAAAAAEKSSVNIARLNGVMFASPKGGRRPSAMSMFIATSKLGSVMVSPNTNRLSVLRNNGDTTPTPKPNGRRGSIQSARFARPHSDSIASTGSGSGYNQNFPFHPNLPQGARPASTRNRRSSIRPMKTDRSSMRMAAWDPLVDGYRASLLSFVTNHSAFAPPPMALPTSYVLNKTGFVQGKTAQQASIFAQQNEDESSFGSKIWGLKITDLRLLFTIEIRDILYMYFARGHDLFSQGPVDTTNTMDGAAPRRPTSVQLKKEKEKGEGKATIYDFMPAPKDDAQKGTQKGGTTKLAAEERTRLGLNPLRMNDPMQGANDPMLQFLTMRNDRSSSSPKNADLAQLLNPPDRAPSPLPARTVNSKVKYQKGGRDLARSNNSPIRYVHEDDEAEEPPSPTKRTAAKDALLEGSDSESELNGAVLGHSSKKSDKVSPSGTPRTLPKSPPRSLFPSIPEEPSSNSQKTRETGSKSEKATNNGTSNNNIGSNQMSPPAPPLGQGQNHNRSSSAIFAAANSVPVGVSPRTTEKIKKKKPLSEFFFIVELIDPQVNFLDVKTHSSLIIVAGRSSLEGKRYTDATLPPRHDSNGTDGRSSINVPRSSVAAGAHADPKRQQEVRLRMDGVSAFTVPSNSSSDPNDDTDVVHWKHMESTECIDGDEIGFYGRKRSGPAAPESPFMRMAIKDFQIRALYIFWTDVTVKEAKTMYLNPSKEELVGTFKLELPVICVDILSWQFYVIMHVVRNVLLVPPPASASRAKQTQSEAEEAEKNKVLELVRDPVLLAKHDIRVNLNNPLDMKNRISRDELKLLIEENLAGAMMNMELGSARFVEVFVGSCTWILRVNSSGSMAQSVSESGHGIRDWEKEQLKVELTGAHATLSYGEDRSASSLFEVQRFWVKDMDPGRDAIALTKTHGTAGLFRKSTTDLTRDRDDTKLDSVVMMPILSQTEHCARCGAAFLLEENHPTACTFHANRDGDPGEYKDMVVIDHLSGAQNTLKAWSCCGRHHAFAPGCSARPHTCKEVMIQIRAETNPTTRVENIDLSILKSVDISIFPNSTYDLQVHITKSLVDVLHKYFSIDDIENYEITAVVTDPPAEEKRPKGWKRVKKAFRPKKAKSASGEDDESLFSDGMSPGGSHSPLFRSPPPGSPQRAKSPLPDRLPSPTTPRMEKEGGRSIISPWFSRSTTPKRSAPLGTDRIRAESADEAATATTDRSHRLMNFVPSLSVHSLTGAIPNLDVTRFFSSRKADGAVDPAVHVVNLEDSQTSSQQIRSFNMMRKRSNTLNNNDKTTGRSSITGALQGLGSNSGGERDQDNKHVATMTLTNRRQEGLYVKFLRLGGIQIEVSTQGFILNLTRFKAQMDEFRCQGEVLQWSTLIGNMERHLAVSLLSNAASNSLSRFTHLFRFPGQHAVEHTDSQDGDSYREPVHKKSAFVMWEGAQDVHSATSMKRSALGLPPSKSKAPTHTRSSSEATSQETTKRSL